MQVRTLPLLKKEMIAECFEGYAEDDLFVIYHINTDEYLDGEAEEWFSRDRAILRVSGIQASNVVVFAVGDAGQIDFLNPVVVGSDIDMSISVINDALREQFGRTPDMAGFNP
jgi:hypothetical protein